MPRHLVVAMLDRFARSLPDARAIADALTVRQVRLDLGGSAYDVPAVARTACEGPLDSVGPRR